MLPDIPQPGQPQPSFLTWLAHNQTGIAPRVALGRTLAGMVLGGLVSLVVTRLRSRTRTDARMLPMLGGVIGGSVLGPLAVVFITYKMDRRWFAGDSLLGFSGVMRELFHAGELSALGALGGGLGSSSSGFAQGLLTGAIGTSVLGGVLYYLRGFGAGVGIGAGLLSGAVSGTLGAIAARLLR